MLWEFAILVLKLQLTGIVLLITPINPQLYQKNKKKHHMLHVFDEMLKIYIISILKFSNCMTYLYVSIIQ